MFTSVLLLDAAMFPLKTISWERAMTLWFQQKARILENQTNEASTPTAKYKVPAVIQLKSYVKKGWDKHIRFSRQNVFSRDNFTCQYCYQKFNPKKLTIEHIMPKSRGGKTNWLNIVAACAPCNQRKEGRTPEEAGMKLLRPPSKPKNMSAFLFCEADSVPETWVPYLSWANKKL